MSVCGREKCAFKRKPYPPGIHGRAFRRGGSEFGSQLKEKQKLRLSYGLRERQFKNYIMSAIEQKAMKTGEAIFNFLESRLDNAVFRMGFVSTRSAARQMVSHGHIVVNGKRISIPSYQVRNGDVIGIRQNSVQKKLFMDLPLVLKKYEAPAWMQLDKEKKTAHIVGRPATPELEKGYNVNAIIEFYSR
jgi:small subunit ribosomal protein S4